MEKTDVKNYKRLAIKEERGDEKAKKVKNISISVKHIISMFLTLITTRASIYLSSISFGPAFFAATFNKNTFIYNLPFVFLGGLSLSGITGAIKYTIISIFYSAYRLFVSTEGDEPKIVKSISLFLCVFVGGMVIIVTNGMVKLDVLMLLLEGIVTVFSALVFEKVIPIIKTFYRRRVLNEEEIIGICLISSIFMLGIAGFDALIGLTFMKAVSVILILTITYYQGITISVMSAVILGVICVLGGGITSLELPTYFAVGAIFASIFKKYGKIFMPLSFFAVVMMLSTWTSPDTFMQTMNGIIIGATIFALMPLKILKYGESLLSKDNLSAIAEESNNDFKEKVSDKLVHLSTCFNDLNKVFLNVNKRFAPKNLYDVSYIFKETCDKVCGSCGLSNSCWNKDYEGTYQVMFKLLEKLNEKGHADRLDTPEYFRDRCVRLNEFVAKVNNLYEIYEVNKRWENEVGETRTLLAKQYKNIANIIENIATEVKDGLGIMKEINDEIIIKADKLGVKIIHSTSYCDDNGRLYADMYVDKKENLNNIIKVVSSVAGKSMTIRESKETDIGLHILVCEKEKFSISCGFFGQAKNKNEQNGDCYKIIRTKIGKVAVILSDGMGSGANAHAESSLAVSLFEKFLCVGFDKYDATQLINSVLFLKSAEETFATIDIAIIDLYNGSCEFIKIGSSASFIKKGDTVDIINSSSLPVGILSVVDFDNSNKNISHGDYIIMLTDGVLDGIDNGANKEEVFKKAIMNIDQNSPTDVAKYLVRIAESKNTKMPSDDKSVIALRIEEVA